MLSGFLDASSSGNLLTGKEQLKELKAPLCWPRLLMLLHLLTNFEIQKYDQNEPKFNPIQDGGRQKGPPTSFSLVTSTNVGFGPRNFLAFSFNPFTTLVQNVKFLPSASPKLLNLNQDHSSKKAIFLVKSL